MGKYFNDFFAIKHKFPRKALIINSSFQQVHRQSKNTTNAHSKQRENLGQYTQDNIHISVNIHMSVY